MEMTSIQEILWKYSASERPEHHKYDFDFADEEELEQMTEEERKAYDERVEEANRQWLQMLADKANEVIGKKPDWFNYECPICKGRGYMTIVDIENKVLAQEDCSCRKIRNVYRYAMQNGMADKLNITLDDWQCEQAWQEKVKQYAINYIERDPEDRWFVMLGQPGSGKTMMCSIVAAEQMKKGREVKYITWPDLLSTLQRNMKADRPDNTMRDLCECEVLFLDDLFKNEPGAWAKDKAFELINYRYNMKKRTIISSEKDIVKLNQIDVGISSRIQQMAGQYIIRINESPKNNWRTK